jgi:hypothetical protein
MKVIIGKAWLELNLFTAGFVMSRLPPDSPQFREGLVQWRIGQNQTASGV